MDIRVLQYFLAVVREENITKAAQLLHITQPTLSRQLMGLEQELGVKLFSRNNHSVTLTEEGMLFRRRAEEIVTLSEMTKRELKQEAMLTGEISIGSGEYHGSCHLSGILAAFRAEHPNVTYSIYSGNSDNIKERIERGTLDIGLLLEPVEISKYDFDIAIIGAGAYSLPLAAYVKQLGKIAVQMSGSTQILFGIKGKRWEQIPEISKFFNENWIRPSEDETPKGSTKVEGGSYW